jgi:D-aminoacyl-tRNA deacylase
MLAIVVSRADSASVHIGEHLREVADWTEHDDPTRSDADGGGTVYRLSGAAVAGAAADAGGAAASGDHGIVELREFDALHLETEGIAGAFGHVESGADLSPELLVFASRHAGETGPLLTAHHTGNFGAAEFGGDDDALARACPGAHREVIAALAEHAPDGYDVGMECTHHGPTEVGAPSMFVELGSGEAEWEDPAGARAVARAVLDLRGVDADLPAASSGAVETDHGGPDRRHLVGLGGGHYAPRFERVTRETDWAVGHVAADWCLEDLAHPDSDAGRAVLRSTFEESAATRALVDGENPAVERAVADLGYRVVSETWARETTGLVLPLVATLEDALGPVDDGTRFGDRAQTMDDTGAAALDTDALTVAALPAELLAEAQGIDSEATRAAVESATLAFETTESGTRAADRAVFLDPADRETLVDELATVLEGEYAVERTDEAVLVRERAFDPERARTLGIPEGPKFGRLSAGQSVEVDGETIDPEVVHVERERRFPVE